MSRLSCDAILTFGEKSPRPRPGTTTRKLIHLSSFRSWWKYCDFPRSASSSQDEIESFLSPPVSCWSLITSQRSGARKEQQNELFPFPPTTTRPELLVGWLWCTTEQRTYCACRVRTGDAINFPRDNSWGTPPGPGFRVVPLCERGEVYIDFGWFLFLSCIMLGWYNRNRVSPGLSWELTVDFNLLWITVPLWVVLMGAMLLGNVRMFVGVWWNAPFFMVLMF